MSEKRFHQFGLWVIDNPNFNGISIADLVDTELMSITEVVDKLNRLSEENEQLRQSIKELQRSREYWIQDNNRLTKKNNELIAKIDFLERVIDGDV